MGNLSRTDRSYKRYDVKLLEEPGEPTQAQGELVLPCCEAAAGTSSPPLYQASRVYVCFGGDLRLFFKHYTYQFT